MTKRALLIGSEISGLRGVQNDIRRMNAWFTANGFVTIIKLQTETVQIDGVEITDATRQGILDGYEKLIADSTEGDVAVVYYSGHGSFAEANQPDEQGEWKQFQFIVPFDFFESTDDDFRGITTQELSEQAKLLTDKTKNVTIIFDCCHSSLMSRTLETARFLDLEKSEAKTSFMDASIVSHIEKLKGRRIEETLYPNGNPFAVRLVACGQKQSAYEYKNSEGEIAGRLTDTFLKTLEAMDGRWQAVSWQTLSSHLRTEIVASERLQRPDIEGPSTRLLFSEEEARMDGRLTVGKNGATFELDGGRIVGVNQGDSYKITLLNVDKPSDDDVIGIATVEKVTPTKATISIEFSGTHTADSLTNGGLAFPQTKNLAPYTVDVVGTSEKADQLRRTIASDSNERLQLAGTDAINLLAKVVVGEKEIQIWNSSGEYMLTYPQSLDEEDGFTTTLENLEKHARAQTVRSLSSGQGEHALNGPIEVEMGHMIDGEPHPLDKSKVVEANGKSIYLRVKNKGDETVYISIFDIGVSAKITSLLKNLHPSGYDLKAGEVYEPFGINKGTKIDWVDGVPFDGIHPESIVVIASSEPLNLSTLQGSGVKRTLLGNPTELEIIVDQIGLGGTREIGALVNTSPLKYAVERADFNLAPPSPPFLIDESHDLHDSNAPRSLVKSLAVDSSRNKNADMPQMITVRLKELIVHRNRALFGTTVRVDSMVVTGAKIDSASESFYMPGTTRFSGISNETRLPMDHMIVYHGPAAHFIDFAVWVSRDQKDSLDLAELVKQELNSSEFKTAAGAISTLVVAIAAPQAAAMVAAVGGAATLINIGAKVLLRATGSSIGLYRTSYLASEQFGIGSHPDPEIGMMSAQDFSFSYEILRN